MKSVCMYFQVHQPYRLKRYQVFDIGNNHEYFDDAKNKEICKKVARDCYIPTNNILLNLIKKHKGRFKVSFSISGTALEQMEQYCPDAILSFKELAKTGCVEFLCETYYHSLASLFSRKELKRQVDMHRRKISSIFRTEPKIFRNTELILNDDICKRAKEMGFAGILGEGADTMLGWRSSNYLYTASGMKLLLRNYRLSDDIAFRFADKSWEHHPLTAEKYSRWILDSEGDIINLFMDYETFGEHQPADSGIFKFLTAFPSLLLEKSIEFVTCSDAMASLKTKGEVGLKGIISWADVERDVSAWLGNEMQENTAKELYMIEDAVMDCKDKAVISDWSRLSTSDHLYYMCTKHFSDGDVHKHFNPHRSPYEAFIAYMNILNDMILRVTGCKNISLTEKPSSFIK